MLSVWGDGSDPIARQPPSPVGRGVPSTSPRHVAPDNVTFEAPFASLGRVPIWPFIVVAAPLAAGVLAATNKSRSRARRTDGLRNTPRTKVEDLVAGKPAKVRGSVEAFEGTLLVPFTQQPCVQYECGNHDDLNAGITRT